MAKDIELEGITCTKCGTHSIVIGDFYKTYSESHTLNGRVHICKDCLNNMLNVYTIRYHSQKKAMKRICMILDWYYHDDIYNSSVKTGTNIIGNYVKKLNINPHKGKTFETSIVEGFTFDEQDARQDTKEEIEENTPDPADVEKWGEGFDVIDYRVLNAHEKQLKSANPNYDSNQEIFITDLCYTKMQQMKALRSDDRKGYSDMSEQYRRFFNDSGLKSVKDTSVDEGFTFGVNIETIEKYTPAEYYKDKELYKDFDGLEDYFERFILRPLKNLMHGTSNRDTEFYVKDEDAGDVNE